MSAAICKNFGAYLGSKFIWTVVSCQRLSASSEYVCVSADVARHRHEHIQTVEPVHEPISQKEELLAQVPAGAREQHSVLHTRAGEHAAYAVQPHPNAKHHRLGV